MIRTFRFDKDPDGRWYVNLPEWEGERGELEMVLGADILLDILANGCDWVDIEMSETPFSMDCKMLIHDRSESELGWYNNDAWHGPTTIWLCHVTEFVFGYYPDVIYYR